MNILGWWLFKARGRSQPGLDILMKLEIELVDAFRGTTRTIEIRRDEFCAQCSGSGWRAGSIPAVCDDCGGRGEVISVRRFFPVAITCPACSGQKPPVTDPCPSCRGTGRRAHITALCVDIPPGVETGMTLQLRNQGALGDVGAARGNLRIRLTVKDHADFERRQIDLYCRLAVPSTAMAEGAKVQVSTLGGGNRQLSIPTGTRNGDTLRIKGAGMPDIGGRVRGDLCVEIVRE
jgi:molecular chaperone DnaJ